MIWKHSLGVMPALVAGIHVFPADFRLKDVDGRDKPGHDSELMARYDRNGCSIQLEKSNRCTDMHTDTD